MPDGPHLQAERVFVQARGGEADFCPFRGPGARLPRTDTIPVFAAEINPVSGDHQKPAPDPRRATNSFLQHPGIDG